MLNWVDLVVVVIMATVALVEARRGFGRAILDFTALILAVRGTYMLAGPLSRTISLAPGQAANEAILYAISFIVLGGVLLYLGKLVYDLTLLSAGVFDPLLGGIFGIGAAAVLCHVFVRLIALSAGTDGLPDIVAASALGREFLTFDTYYAVVDTLYNFDRPLPN